MIKVNALNEFDKGYQYLLSSILDEGEIRDTRAGQCISTFGKEFKIDLKKGFPILTTKKMFTKGVIYELLWFLQHPQDTENGMNIKYLVDNNVHIWDADAFRWFHTWITKEIKQNETRSRNRNFDFRVRERAEDGSFHFAIWDRNDEFKNNFDKLESISKEDFLEFVKDEVVISVYIEQPNGAWKPYQFGDLGKVYGFQWRMWENPIDDENCAYIDQIEQIIHTLKTNPTDRRMLCTSLNVAKLNSMALPPCHVMFQVYARKLTRYERWNEYKERFGETQEYNNAIDTQIVTSERIAMDCILDENNIPTYGLSCKYTMRSCDEFLGQPFNIMSYALLTHMVAKLVNMVPDTLISSMGDCHIYCAHIDAVKEQLQRKGSETLPKLKINGTQKTINDFKFEDFEIIGYNPDPPIKAPLLVGA